MPKAAVLDANVLVPVTLTDLLLSLAEKDLFRPIWTDMILHETAVAADRTGRGDIRPRISAMRASFPLAIVRDWPDYMGDIDLPDPGDAHVVAAAVAGKADEIVTANLRDFPPESMPPGITAIAPDDFLLAILRDDTMTVLQVIDALLARTSRPPISLSSFLTMLERIGTPRFVAALRDHMS